MTEKIDIQRRLFEIMFKLDKASAEKDFITLRRVHYDNMDWLRENGLIIDYFDYMYEVRESEGDYDS